MPDKPKRLLRGRGTEVSSLTQDNPAQPGAQVVGRKSTERINQKNDFTALLSSIAEGHRHSASLGSRDGQPTGLTSFGYTSNGRYHDHKMRFDDNEDVELFEMNEYDGNGNLIPDLHKHFIPREEAISYLTSGFIKKNKNLSSSDARSKAEALLEEIVGDSSNVTKANTTEGNNKMTPEEIKKMEEENTFLKAEKEKLPLMNDDVTKHYDSLSDEDKKEFIKLSPDQMEKKLDGFMSKFSNMFKKSDKEDPVLEAVKELTTTVKSVVDRMDNLEKQGISAKSKETGLPEWMIKAAEAEGPEALELLKSNETLKEQFKAEARKSKSKGGDEVEVIEVAKGDHEAAYKELTKMAQSKMKKDKSLSFADAYDEAKADRPDLAEAVV